MMGPCKVMKRTCSIICVQSYEHVTGNNTEILEGIPIANDVDHGCHFVTSISLVEETHNFEDIIHVKNEEKAEDDVDDC